MLDRAGSTPGFAAVCNFDGDITQVLWDDLALSRRLDDPPHFASLLDEGSVQKALSMFHLAKQQGAAFGWEINVQAEEQIRLLSFTAAAVDDRVILMATAPLQEEGRIRDGLSHLVNEQVNSMRVLSKRAARGVTPAEEPLPGRFDSEMVRDMLVLNNRLVNAERELARRNSELRRLSAVLSKDLHLAHRVVQASGEAVVIADHARRVVEVNQAYTAITGYSRFEALGTDVLLCEGDRQSPGVDADIWDLVAQRGSWQGECTRRRKGGELFPQWLSVSAVPDDLGGRPHFVVSFSDITRLKTAEEKWQRLAYYDSLTGLANRVLFKDRLRNAMALARRGDEPLAVLFIDLDDFKVVNDSLGHGAGDELLCQAARRIEASVRETDSVARLGGDEFTVILQGCPGELEALHVCDKIVGAFAQQFQVEQHRLHISASIGIARFPADGDDVDTLIKNADAAMYAAKSAGRNTCRFFSRALGDRINEQLHVRTQIAQGLQRGEFMLHLQPEVDLATGRVLALEALVRWEHPQRGTIPPAQFIPVAEDSGLIVDLGQFVIREALRLVGELRAGGWPDLRVAVNVSPRQLATPGLSEFIVAELGRQGLPGACLVVEITESLVMHDMDHAVQVLGQLREHGVGAAIDDFGIGYSSLSALRSLPVEFLKIDRSFVDDADVSPESATIVRAIIAMARSLGLKTVAEGIERHGQFDLLRRLGCDLGQGYWFARPSGAAEIGELIEAVARGGTGSIASALALAAIPAPGTPEARAAGPGGSPLAADDPSR